MLLYTAKTRLSMLLPNACDPSWTDLSRVFSDQPPGVAGSGALQIAQQALDLSPTDAATLVQAAGATNVSSSALVSGAVIAKGPIPNPRGVNGVRLPIPSNVNTILALLNGDVTRSFILIQNNSASTGATLLVSVDGPVNTAIPWAYLNIAGGQGILLDEEIMTNPIYVAWGTGTVVGGVIFYGSSLPLSTGNAAVSPAIRVQ